MKKTTLLFIFFIVYFSNIITAQTTVGLIQHSTGSIDNGAVLFAPIANKQTFLIDKCGKLLHTWLSEYNPAYSAYLLPDGALLRTGDDPTITPRGGIIEKIEWDGNVTWSYKISSDTVNQHHDIKALPNGNILVIIHEDKTQVAAIAMGRNPSNIINQKLSSEKIIEIQPIGIDSAIVVWEWKVWDHLIQDFDNTKPNFGTVSEHSELLNVNFINGHLNADWLHSNSVDYNEEFNQVMISFRNIGEIWIIDHSTTTAEAASHSGGNSGKGGDILYRWGNPLSYNQGSQSNHKFFAQHDARWLKNGNEYTGKIMVFNNGTGRPSGNFSSIDIISPPVDLFGNYSSVNLPLLPATQSWQYFDTNPTSFYSATMSGAQLLSNGNILICDANAGIFFEIDSTKNKVWEYQSHISPNGPLSQGDITTNISDIFKCQFYSFSYSGFNGHELIPSQPIELNPIQYDCFLDTISTNVNFSNQVDKDFLVYPNPAKNNITILFSEASFNKETLLRIYNSLGKEVFKQNIQSENTNIDMSFLPKGVFMLVVVTNYDKKVLTKKIIKN